MFGVVDDEGTGLGLLGWKRDGVEGLELGVYAVGREVLTHLVCVRVGVWKKICARGVPPGEWGSLLDPSLRTQLCHADLYL